MRKLLLATIAATGLCSAQPCLAFEEPWCVKANLGGGWVRDICDFRTFEQCRQERYFYGPTALCVHNPYLMGYEPAAVKKRKARRIDH